MLTMQEENTEDEFQKIYARRIENETFLKQVLYDTEKVYFLFFVYLFIYIFRKQKKFN